MSAVRDISELPFRTYEEFSKPDVYTNIIGSLRLQQTTLNMAFFSRRNVDRIQNDIRCIIRKKLGYGISRQSDDQLLIVMRAVFMQDADQDPVDPRAELERLNGIVAAQCAPIIASNIKQFLGYLEDASKIPAPLERGINTSIKGFNTAMIDRSI
jgi:hypothetical protein